METLTDLTTTPKSKYVIENGTRLIAAVAWRTNEGTATAGMEWHPDAEHIDARYKELLENSDTDHQVMRYDVVVPESYSADDITFAIDDKFDTLMDEALAKR